MFYVFIGNSVVSSLSKFLFTNHAHFLAKAISITCIIT